MDAKTVFENQPKIDWQTEIAGIKLEYPIMNCSGCLDIEAIEQGKYDISRLGAIVSKGISLLPKQGNPMPRVCEVPSGLINAIGLENPGLEIFAEQRLPRLLALAKKVIVNIFGNTVEEFVAIAQRLDKTDIAGLEVNISCPNVKEGGMIFGSDPRMAAVVTRAVRQATSKPILVKLTPMVTDIVAIARAVVDEGADAISLINTIPAMAVDVWTRRPKIGNIVGGQSGPSIGAIALRQVYAVCQANPNMDAIAMGGINSGTVAAEFFMVGAKAIEIGTGGFTNRFLPNDVVDGMERVMRFHGWTSIKQMQRSLILPEK